MASALLDTKLYAPRRRRRLVPRPQLPERLNRVTESKLTPVSAPAGFGKTTLLAEWLPAVPADERSVAWLSVDQSDNDAPSFWTYLITSLQTVAPRVRARAISLLQEPQPPPIETVLAALLNELGAVPNDIVLVLDDYHAVHPGVLAGDAAAGETGRGGDDTARLPGRLRRFHHRQHGVVPGRPLHRARRRLGPPGRVPKPVGMVRRERPAAGDADRHPVSVSLSPSRVRPLRGRREGVSKCH